MKKICDGGVVKWHTSKNAISEVLFWNFFLSQLFLLFVEPNKVFRII